MSVGQFSERDIQWIREEINSFGKGYGGMLSKMSYCSVQPANKFYFLMLLDSAINCVAQNLQKKTAGFSAMTAEALKIREAFGEKTRAAYWPSIRGLAKEFPILAKIADKTIASQFEGVGWLIERQKKWFVCR